MHTDGGMADYVCVPAQNVVAADGLTLDEAAMVEFLAIGAHAVRRANPQKGDRIAVVGAGPIGVGCMIAAKLRGADVTALDMRPDRLAFAQSKLGADHAVIAGPNALEELRQLTDGDLFDIVIDATGNAKAMMAGFDYVAHGGSYVFVSIVLDSITFSDPEFHKRETTLLGSRNATREDFVAVVDAMRQGRVPTAALVTHRSSLEDAPNNFPLWIKPETGVIKALDRDLTMADFRHPAIRHQPLPAGARRPFRLRSLGAPRGDRTRRRRRHDGEPRQPQTSPGFRRRAPLSR